MRMRREKLNSYFELANFLPIAPMVVTLIFLKTSTVCFPKIYMYRIHIYQDYMKFI